MLRSEYRRTERKNMKQNKGKNIREIKEEDRYLYFKDGRQKKKYMKCHDPQYISEVKGINGYYNPAWVCAGNECVYYSRGCNK